MFFPTLRCRSWLLAALFVVPAFSSAQGVDTEPNNTCPDAQFFGEPVRPFVVDGIVNGVPGLPDVDFFAFDGQPGDPVLLQLRGELAGAGTLSSPILGVFDENCSFLTLVDTSFGVDPVAVIRVPAGGRFVAAATAFPDYGLQGAETTGSYQLVMSTPPVIDSIRGRLVNANTGAPVTGDSPTFAAVFLLRCSPEVGCNVVNGRSVENDGTFFFDGTGDGQPLLAGEFQVNAVASGFQELYTAPVVVAAGEAFDLGDIGMIPFEVIGSVRTRLVDALDGSPIPGFSPPFAFAVLERCEGDDCFGVVGMPSEFDGTVLFDGALNFVAPGEYRVSAFADDYREVTTSRFTVGAFEDVDLGDLQLTPFQIRFGEATGCEVTTAGGLCNFGIEFQNRGPGRYDGEAWATVNYFALEFPFRPVQFQVGRRGAADPRPERVRLGQGESGRLEFVLPVPAGVPENSSLCVTAVVGSGRQPQFDNQGDRFLFCAVVSAGELQMVTGSEGRKLFRKLQQHSDDSPRRRRD